MTSWTSMQVPYLLDGRRRCKALMFTAFHMSVQETLRVEWLLFASVVGDILGVGASSEILIPLQCTEPYVTLLRGSCRDGKRKDERLGLTFGWTMFIHSKGSSLPPTCTRYMRYMRCGSLWGWKWLCIPQGSSEMSFSRKLFGFLLPRYSYGSIPAPMLGTWKVLAPQ